MNSLLRVICLYLIERKDTLKRIVLIILFNNNIEMNIPFAYSR